MNENAKVLFFTFSDLQNFRPRLCVTLLFSHKSTYQSLFSVRVVCDAEWTSLTTQVVALISIKNTNDNNFSSSKRLKLTDMKDPVLRNENSPKITPDKTSSAQIFFNFIEYPGQLFMDLDHTFSKKSAEQPKKEAL